MGDKEENGKGENVKLATETLQQLGLKEYEAKVFVALCRVPMSTAKRVSELSGVPRPRVYDAIRILEARGLVEVEHSSPKKFRSISLDEATKILQERYDDRIDRLRGALNEVEEVDADEKGQEHEVWSMSDTKSIDGRAKEMVEEAEREIIFAVGTRHLLNQTVVGSLKQVDDEVELLVGVPPGLRDRVREEVGVEGVRILNSDLSWLGGESDASDDEPVVGRLVLVDREKVLVSSFVADTMDEHAIFGTGFGNGLVTVARNLMTKK